MARVMANKKAVGKENLYRYFTGMTDSGTRIPALVYCDSPTARSRCGYIALLDGFLTGGFSNSTVKYAWIHAQHRHYPLLDLCEVLAVSIIDAQRGIGSGCASSGWEVAVPRSSDRAKAA